MKFSRKSDYENLNENNFKPVFPLFKLSLTGITTNRQASAVTLRMKKALFWFSKSGYHLSLSKIRKIFFLPKKLT